MLFFPLVLWVLQMDDTQHLGNFEAGFDSVILGQQGSGQWMPLGFTEKHYQALLSCNTVGDVSLSD